MSLLTFLADLVCYHHELIMVVGMLPPEVECSPARHGFQMIQIGALALRSGSFSLNWRCFCGILIHWSRTFHWSSHFDGPRQMLHSNNRIQSPNSLARAFLLSHKDRRSHDELLRISLHSGPHVDNGCQVFEPGAV